VELGVSVALEAAGPRKLTALDVGMLLGAVAVCRALAIGACPIYDDAFITFRYAQNLAHGAGLVFNPGAAWEPVLGTTTPGFAVLLAFFAKLGLAPDRAARAFGIACDVASAWLLCRLLDRRVVAASIAVALFAAAPEIARIAVGGMEMPLLVLLALTATSAIGGGRFALSGMLAALACTVRPEAVLFAGALAAFHVRSLRQLARFAAPLVVVGALYAGALTYVYGSPIPQSVRAKADNHGLGAQGSRVLAIAAQAFAPSAYALALLPIASLGIVLAFLWRSAARAFIAFALAVVCAYALAGAKTWGWYFYAPLTAWSIACGLGCEAVFEFVARAVQRIETFAKLAPFALALLAVAAVATYARLRPDRVTPLVYEPMRAWCDSERPAAHGARIVASDIGALGFFSGALILDSEGLVWPQARGSLHQVDVVRDEHPEYAMFVANQARLATFLRDPIAQGYEPVARFNTRGDRELHPSIDSLPDRWEQDYVVFRRKTGSNR
jgi:hypothetical protein